MNKIPNENWQAYMLRTLSEETATIWVPAWVASAARAVGRVFGGLFVLCFFASIPVMAFEVACMMLGL